MGFHNLNEMRGGLLRDMQTILDIVGTESAVNAARTAGSIGKNLTDLNGDGRVDVEDLKLAAEKAGIA